MPTDAQSTGSGADSVGTTGEEQSSGQPTAPDTLPDTQSSQTQTDSSETDSSSVSESGPSATDDTSNDGTTGDGETSGNDETTGGAETGAGDPTTGDDDTAGDTGTLVCVVAPDQASSLQEDSLNYPAWQSFTAGSSGELVALDAMPNTFCGGSGIAGQLTILQGQGVAGEVLYEEDYTPVSMGGLNLVTFAVDPPVPLEAGVQYTWSLSGTCGLGHSNADAYPGGIGGGISSVDMVFETHVETCE